MVSTQRALFLACLPVVLGPLVLVWAWPQSRMFEHVFTVLVTGLLIAGLVAIRAGRLIAAPIEQLNETARSMANGQFQRRVEAGGTFTPQELKTLTQTFNHMAERLADLDRRGAELRDSAQRASDSKSEFMRTVTHELRSPLNAIIGFSDLLLGRTAAAIPPEVRDGYLADINAGAQHLLSLVNDLLDLSRAESGQYELVEDEFGLDEITARAARYVEAQARERQMLVTVAFDGEPPVVYGDERALFQALLNLLSNAVRYGRTGGTIQIDVRRLGALGIELMVTDDGPGIAPEDLERVMLPFQRARNAGASAVRGSGLGLPIVKQFVELHGGAFELTSIHNWGTRARILLPAVRVRNAAARPLNPVFPSTVAKAA